MSNTVSLMAVVLAAGVLGCTQTKQDDTGMPASPMTGDPSGIAQSPSGAPSMTMQPPATNTPTTGNAGTGAMQPMKPADKAKSGSGGMNGTDAMMGNAGAAAPDPCSGFVVSRSTPCSDDPNPCNIHSGYPGDEYCLPPPKPDEGIQVHFGPKDYTNTTEVAEYILKANEEINGYGVAPIPLTEERYYNRVVYHMRPGSHHLINSLIDSQPTPGFASAQLGCPGNQIGSLGGTQNLIYDSRPNGIVPPENEGIGYTLPANASICFNFHRYNFTDADAISEIWVNFYFVDEKDVTQHARWGAAIGGLAMNVAPHTEQDLTYSYTFSGVDTSTNPRIIQLFGHRHAATYHFEAWLNDDLIYDSWDWKEAITVNFDSLTNNPPIQSDMMKDGARSGVVAVKDGDELKYTCHVRNDTDAALRFGNELYTAEMCNLFGQAVGTSFGGLNP